ncbi:G/T mismatch-specific thymine DNA glycosylase-like [Tropilaelaps mercedesae]|uniref:G/T mismatch-specific thymine DNA glycosylase n=1 Tax=Tropilaelaps mercedesae TaxID=418985 RepID=A0A1V9XWC4_9ACAR|nr:G/T mismatch-specific thymine DNA glycosylase-like [Tropilaelaps mercedesae]
MAAQEGKQFKQFLQKFSCSKIPTVFNESSSSVVVSRSPESERKILENGILPDYIQHGLDILVVGINPGFFSARERRYYAGPGNHFWKCLYQSKLIPEPVTWEHDSRLLEWNIGLTNICARATRGQADLSKDEIAQGAKILVDKIKEFRPKIVVFNGKGIYEIFIGSKVTCLGRQESFIDGVEIFVIPSSSPRSSLYPTAEAKLPFYVSLKKLVDVLNSETPVDNKRFCFEIGATQGNSFKDGSES